MKTKPFNLEEALAGKAVVTADGREVTQLHKFVTNAAIDLAGVIDGVLCTTTDIDLRMKCETKTIEGWVND